VQFVTNPLHVLQGDWHSMHLLSYSTSPGTHSVQKLTSFRQVTHGSTQSKQIPLEFKVKVLPSGHVGRSWQVSNSVKILSSLHSVQCSISSSQSRHPDEHFVQRSGEKDNTVKPVGHCYTHESSCIRPEMQVVHLSVSVIQF